MDHFSRHTGTVNQLQLFPIFALLSSKFKFLRGSNWLGLDLMPASWPEKRRIYWLAVLQMLHTMGEGSLPKGITQLALVMSWKVAVNISLYVVHGEFLISFIVFFNFRFFTWLFFIDSSFQVKFTMLSFIFLSIYSPCHTTAITGSLWVCFNCLFFFSLLGLISWYVS